MSNSQKTRGAAAKVLSTALSAAMVVAFTPAAAMGDDYEATVDDTGYATLEEAVAAVNGAEPSEAVPTIKLLKNATVEAQVTLGRKVVFDGNNRTLTRTGEHSSDAGLNGGLLIAASGVVVKNLTIDGLNTTIRTENGAGWDDGEYGLKVYGDGVEGVKLSNVSVTGSNAGIQVNRAKASAEGTLNVSGNEWGGIEVCNGGTLDASDSDMVDTTETEKAPVAWNDGSTDGSKGKLLSSRALYVKNMDNSTKGTTKDHYYLDPGYADVTSMALDTDQAFSEARGISRVFSFKPAEDGDYVFSSSAAGSGRSDPYASLRLDSQELASNDDTDGEAGDLNFRIYQSLEAGKTYLLRVGGYSESCNVNVRVSKYVESIADYTMSAKGFFYSGTSATPAAAGLAIRSKKDPSANASAKFKPVQTYRVVDGGTDVELFSAPSTPGEYYFLATPADDSGMSGSLRCDFTIYDSANIDNYWYEADFVSVYGSSQVTLPRLNLKIGRFGTDTAATNALPASAYAFDGWYDAVYDSGSGDYNPAAEARLTAPAAAGKYFVKLKGVGSYTGTTYVLFDAITERIAAVPTARTGLVYSGSAQTGVYAGTGYTVTGGSATNAGGYSAVAKLADGYVWADGTKEDKAIPWYISQAKVAVPTAVTGLKYTGSAQTGVSAAYNVKLSGTYSATNAGSYTATASLPSYNYVWADNTSGSKVLSWSIGKGSLPVTVDASKATVYRGSTYTLGYSYAGDGAVTVKSSNPGVATATKTAAGTVTVTPVAAGTTVVTITAAGTANCEIAVGVATITVTAPAAAPEGSFINADGTFAGGSNGGAPGSATDAQQAAATYKVTTPSGSSTPTVAYLGGAATGSVSIPSTVKDQNGVTYRVTSIEPGALKGTSATKVTVGGYVKTIGSSAFSGCAGLTSLTIGKNVASVGKYVIKDCAKLKAVTVKSSKLTKLGIRNLVKGTKVTTIKCSGLSKQIVAKYAKWVKLYNKKVTVK